MVVYKELGWGMCEDGYTRVCVDLSMERLDQLFPIDIHLSTYVIGMDNRCTWV